MPGVSSDVGPTSWPLIVLLVALALCCPLLVALWWRRLRAPGRPTRRVTVALAGLVVASQLFAVLATAAIVNRSLGFYPTWEAVGRAFLDDTDSTLDPVVIDGNDAAPAPGPSHPAGKPSAHPAYRPPGEGTGKYVDHQVTGAASKATLPVRVWLPPGYEDGKDLAGLPVLTVYNGAYVPLAFAADKLDLATAATPLIREGKIPPFVAVMPEINLALPKDTECTDIPGGALAYTWLAQDVPAWAQSTLGLNPDHSRWSVMGWSVGAYCAGKLHVRNPSLFAAAAVVQGHFDAWPDDTTGNLAAVMKANPTLRNEASVAWVITHRDPKPLRLLVAYSPADPQSYPRTKAFLDLMGQHPGVFAARFEGLGHTWNDWRVTLPTVLPFLLGAGSAAPGDKSANG